MRCVVSNASLVGGPGVRAAGTRCVDRPATDVRVSESPAANESEYDFNSPAMVASDGWPLQVSRHPGRSALLDVAQVPRFPSRPGIPVQVGPGKAPHAPCGRFCGRRPPQTAFRVGLGTTGTGCAW